MKKIIAVLTLLLAFSINANAQDKKTQSSTEMGQNQATELAEYLGLDQTQNENFARLFEQKCRIFENENLSAERKTELSRVIEAKIRASLDQNQMEKLEKNTVLFNKLIN